MRLVAKLTVWIIRCKETWMKWHTVFLSIANICASPDTSSTPEMMHAKLVAKNSFDSLEHILTLESQNLESTWHNLPPNLLLIRRKACSLILIYKHTSREEIINNVFHVYIHHVNKSFIEALKNIENFI